MKFTVTLSVELDAVKILKDSESRIILVLPICPFTGAYLYPG